VIEAVAHGFHDEKAHDQRQQPLEPVRQHVHDDLLPRQKAEQIPDGATLERMPARCKSDHGAGDIAGKITEGGVDEESLEFLTGEGRFQEAVHGANPCRFEGLWRGPSISENRAQPTSVERSPGKTLLMYCRWKMATVIPLTVLCFDTGNRRQGPQAAPAREADSGW